MPNGRINYPESWLRTGTPGRSCNAYVKMGDMRVYPDECDCFPSSTFKYLGKINRLVLTSMTVRFCRPTPIQWNLIIMFNNNNTQDWLVIREYTADDALTAYRASCRKAKKLAERDVNEFPRLRSWGIFARTATGRIFGAVTPPTSVYKTNWRGDLVYGSSVHNRKIRNMSKKGTLSIYALRELEKELCQKIQKKVAMLKQKYPHADIFMARLGSKKCPVNIIEDGEWSEVKVFKPKCVNTNHSE